VGAEGAEGDRRTTEHGGCCEEGSVHGANHAQLAALRQSFLACKGPNTKRLAAQKQWKNRRNLAACRNPHFDVITGWPEAARWSNLRPEIAANVAASVRQSGARRSSASE
jgi:hypothetical protein